MTTSLAKKLQSELTPSTKHIEGIAAGVSTSNYVATVILSSAFQENGDFIHVQCQVVVELPKTPSNHDRSKFYQMPSIKGKQLADAGFGKTTKIKILLGVGVCNSAFYIEHVKTEEPAIRLSKSIFGWTISGEFGILADATNNNHCTGVVLSVTPTKSKETDQLLQHLWERQETPESSAVAQYLDEYLHLPSGRYQVSLPWKYPEHHELDESRSQALKRFFQNERTLFRRDKLKDFNQVLEEYETMGHAEKVPQKDLSKPEQQTYYLPMHGVFKSSSSTTKLRLVFDASAKSLNGFSLNDLLLPGPSLYPMITSIVIKFRSHQIAISSDISKMFREVILNPKHKDYHRFLRRNLKGAIEDWRRVRLTFGVSSCPYLVSQVL